MGRRLEKKHRHSPRIPEIRECPNCKAKLTRKESGHFVPPSFGDKGFFVCEKKDT